MLLPCEELLPCDELLPCEELLCPPPEIIELVLGPPPDSMELALAPSRDPVRPPLFWLACVLFLPIVDEVRCTESRSAFSAEVLRVVLLEPEPVRLLVLPFFSMVLVVGSRVIPAILGPSLL